MEIMYVLGAAVVNQIIGAIWYSSLAKQWMQAWGLTEKDVNKKDPVPYIIAFMGSIWCAYGLFLTIKHIEPQSIDELLGISIGAWLLFCVGMSAKHYAFAGKSLKAFAIDYGVDLIGFIVMGLIIYQI